MIIREWRGRAAKSNAGAYPKHFRTSVVLPELQQVPGFVGADLSQRVVNDQSEYSVLTKWRSMEVIRGFAATTLTKLWLRLAPWPRSSISMTALVTMRSSRPSDSPGVETRQTHFA
jgi:hypothetical protein